MVVMATVATQIQSVQMFVFVNTGPIIVGRRFVIKCSIGEISI